MSRLLLSLAAVASVFACPQHDINAHQSTINKRADGSQDWAYEASYNWGMINPNYTLCQIGTQQSPIQLLLTQGLSSNHIPKFAYSNPISGSLYNWGYGPAFTLNSTNSSSTGSHDITSHPSLTYDNTTIYLKGWHIHAPADHSVQGDRSKAELHLVHADADGHEKGVIAIRIDPGNADSAFFQQFLQTPSSDSTVAKRQNNTFPPFGSTEQLQMEMTAETALREVNMFNDFWTYKGSLTSPPCTEGIRWWVARQVLFVSNRQMQEILAVSTYSARIEQEVWLHGINV